MNASLCIVGCGPTGLMLGCLAQINGIKSIIIEKNAHRDYVNAQLTPHTR
jgi:2-polyprenyl-6-methoxyphenol hydroxylase-like FAD-dependent oxidoreductase